MCRPPSPLWQVPRTSEIYVHRSGRTARATSEGLSLMLIGPEDVINFKKIYKTLKKDEDIPLFPVQTKYMDAVKVKRKVKAQCCWGEGPYCSLTCCEMALYPLETKVSANN